ncbi:MAG: cell surface protein SprA, partial [Muribaculaceae bacterium]|nr:cell surface protein SprA [Muribaculaceae bacterium]
NTNMSRYYYEQQTRSEIDQMFQLPVSVSKNFLWDRQLNLTWNITKTLNLSFNSNTSARIEETVGAVNRRLFPDKYREWRDTVWQSILSMGTPWSYNQTFNAQYKAPFSRIPVLDMLTANLTYNATYRWDRGAEVDGVRLGNSIASQSSWTTDGRLNFENIYNKVPILKRVNQRFANKRPTQQRNRKPKKFERTYQLKPDTSLVIRHNLRTGKVRVSAVTVDGKPFAIKSKSIDQNSVEILTRGNGTNIKFTVTEIIKEKKNVWTELADYSLRLAMSPRNLSVRYRNTRSLTLPLYSPNVGNVFGQSLSYGPMAPGLDFAFGMAGREYIDKAIERNWLITDDGQTSPALWSNGQELNIEGTVEPLKGLKIQLTMNHTDNRTQQVQFMYSGMPTSYNGSYTKTHMALSTALRSSSAKDGYASAAFTQFLENIPIVRDRVEAQYAGYSYPDVGFLSGTAQAGTQFSPEVGAVSATSGDVLIPAFIAAYSGYKADKVYLNPFPSFKYVLPNWRVSYDGFINLGRMRDIFKTFTVSHAYQCTYSVGSYSSYLNWVSVDGERLGFTLDELSGQPIPSSPFNISSVAITERFSPLVGVNATLKNDLRINVEYKDQRTLTLNTSAGQVVEASQRGLTVGAGYKIVGFNSVLKIKNTQTGISNDLTLNADFTLNHNSALIRRIEANYTQPTSGTNSWRLNFTANYVMSRRVTLAAYFEHQVNNPIVTTSSYPTSNTSYGVSFNLSLAR